MNLYLLPLVIGLALLVAGALRIRLAKAAALTGVRVGDLWEFVDGRNRGVYQVVRPNDSIEAGPDSWVMDGNGGRTCYMHHNQRVRGDWVLVMRDGVPTTLSERRKQRRGYMP